MPKKYLHYDNPLLSAVKDGNYDSAESLLKLGARISTLDESNYSALHTAVKYNYIELAKLLLDYGADVNLQSIFNGTPLHIAVDNKNYDIAKLLLDYNASVSIPDRLGYTSLHSAVRIMRPDFIKLLLQYANENIIDIQNKYGNTPLHLAALLDDMNSIETLLLYKPNIKIHNNDNETPIDIAYDDNIRQFLMNRKNVFYDENDNTNKNDNNEFTNANNEFANANNKKEFYYVLYKYYPELGTYKFAGKANKI